MYRIGRLALAVAAVSLCSAELRAQAVETRTDVRVDSPDAVRVERERVRVDRNRWDWLEDRDGMYLAATAGYTMPTDPDFELPISTPIFSDTISDELRMDEGVSATVAIGRYYGPWRFEVEGGYRYNEFDYAASGPVPGFGTGTLALDGDFQTITAMLNVYFDIPLNDRWNVYLGAGAGAAFTTADFDATFAAGGITFSGSERDDDTVFAYQGMAGVSYAATERLVITLGYRLFHTTDYSFGDLDVDSPWIHTAEIGFRWSL
jgi:opacity protein-like surface antigen